MDTPYCLAKNACGTDPKDNPYCLYLSEQEEAQLGLAVELIKGTEKLSDQDKVTIFALLVANMSGHMLYPLALAHREMLHKIDLDKVSKIFANLCLNFESLAKSKAST